MKNSVLRRVFAGQYDDALPRADLRRAGLLFLFYTGTALFGLSLSPVSGFAALVWPPTGIAIAMLFLFGMRLWPAVFIGAWAVNLYMGASAAAAFGIAAGNASEAVAGAWLLHTSGVPQQLERVRDVLAVLLTALVVPLASATIGVASLSLAGAVPPGAFGETWRAWWIGDALAVLVVLPAILAWRSEPSPFSLPLRRMAEGAAVGVTLLGAGLVIFGDVPVFASSFPFVFVIFVVFLWSSRLGQRNVATSGLILSGVVIWHLARGTGIFQGPALIQALFGTQIFIGMMSGTAMVLAAAMHERTRAMEELRQRAEDLEYHRGLLMQAMAKDDALFQSIGEAIVVVGRDGRIALANTAFEKIAGRGDFAGKRLSELWDLHDTEGNAISEADRPAARALAAGSKSVRVRCVMAFKDGRRIPVAVTASPYLQEDRIIGVVVVMHDARKEAEIDRAKNEFVSLASHQLRTPLSIINWHLEAIMSKGAHRAMGLPYRRYIAECFAATRRLFGMVSALLNISRIEANTFSITPRPVALARLVREARESFDREIAAKDITVEERFSPHPPHIPLDPGIMRITLENLISNAVKYTPVEGRIMLGIAQKNSHILVSVADTGYGIPRDARGKIFSKFFRAENVAQKVPDGNGLGLYIVKSVLERAGGSISFVSRPGHGTRFTVTLPVSGMSRRQGNTTLVSSV